MFEISVEHTFAAGHALRNYHGKCENVHGHNYRVQVGMEGRELDENGLLYDFAELKKRLRTTSEYMDHQFLNDLKPFDEINPSAENIAKFIYGRDPERPEERVACVRARVGDGHLLRGLPTVSFS